MNADANGERTGDERGANERMRELGRRSGEARRRKAKAKQTAELEPVGDREQAMAALRRALDGGNNAAMVAAAKALLEFDRTPIDGPVSVEDARAQLAALVDGIDQRRRGNSDLCQACDGRGYVPRTGGGGG